MRTGLRIGMMLLVLFQGIPALWAALLPLSFYEHFPTPEQAWLTLYPPYNEHLTRDFGLVGLQFAVALGYAAFTLERRLVRALLIASLVFNVPHLVYHQHHIVGGSDVHVQLASQLAPIVAAFVLLAINQRATPPAATKDVEPSVPRRDPA